MAQRITRKMIDNATDGLLRALKANNVIPPQSVAIVHEGSSTYGNSWGLTLRVDGEDGRFPGVNLTGCYTKREAYERIVAAAYCAWEIHNTHTQNA